MKPSFSTIASDKLPELTFRKIDDSDHAFLSRLYASTRHDEMQQVDWPAQQVANFLQSQFDAQHAHYQQHYRGASFDLILHDNEPIGRRYLDSQNDEIRIIDIALLPERRGNGVGTMLLTDILDRAAIEKKAVRIHVEKFNPAMRLYSRLGFVQLEDRGVYLFLEWRPGGSTPASGARHG